MAIIEIRTGLRRLDFTRKTEVRADEAATHVVVEFEVKGQLARDQLVVINLGLHDGIARELMGLPKLVTRAPGQGQLFTYRLEGDVP